MPRHVRPIYKDSRALAALPPLAKPSPPNQPPIFQAEDTSRISDTTSSQTQDLNVARFNLGPIIEEVD